MGSESVDEIADGMREIGVPRDFGPENSRLLIRVWKALAKGRPLNAEQVAEIAAELGMQLDAAEEFLRGASERNADDNIVGIVGLSLNEQWVHRFDVDGTSLRTWCAWDSLFLPPMLGQTATIESESPQTGKTVRADRES